MEHPTTDSPSPETLATAIMHALQAEGFDAFRPQGYYDLSSHVWLIIVRVLQEALVAPRSGPSALGGEELRREMD